MKDGWFAAAIIGLIIQFSPSPLMAFGSWNNETTARELIFLFTLAYDYRQTIELTGRPDLFEMNPVLGPDPDVSDVHLYFAGCALGHALITYILPEEMETLWQFFWIGVQADVICTNDRNGLGRNADVEFYMRYSVEF